MPYPRSQSQPEAKVALVSSFIKALHTAQQLQIILILKRVQGKRTVTMVLFHQWMKFSSKSPNACLVIYPKIDLEINSSLVGFQLYLTSLSQSNTDGAS